MPTPQPSDGQQRYERVLASCKKIWGADKAFDFDLETDDYEYYIAVVKEDCGTSFGPPLMLASSTNGPERAWDALDARLSSMARQVGGRECNITVGFHTDKKEQVDLMAAAAETKAGKDAKHKMHAKGAEKPGKA